MSGRAAAVIHDDHAVSSSSDEEEHYDASPMQRSQGQRTPAARGVSYSSVGGSGGGAIGDDVTQRERKLTQLLSRASETIKKERSRIASLEMENDSLRQQLSQAVRGAASSSASEAQTPAVVLRTKLMDLALENFVAVEEIARLRRRVEELEEAAAASATASSQPSSRPASRPRRSHSEHKPVQRYSDASHERRQHDHLHQPVPAAEAPRATSPPRSQRLPPPNHSFDAIKSTKLAHPPPSPPRERTPVKTTGAPHSTAASSVNPGATVVYAASAPPPSVTNAKGVAASSATAAPVPYNDMMLQRLRRAVAPPPTKEQLGEVVHAMVKEMSKFLKSHGTVLDLKRVDHCVYQVRDRKLNLTVDSGRLVVKCGGGHVDLLEYLERNRICTRAEQ